jgi:hypothetical protein
MSDVADKRCRGNKNKKFYLQKLFPENTCSSCDNGERFGIAGKATEDN